MRTLCLAVGVTVALVMGSQSAAAQAPDGQALYREHCRSCHGTDGHPTKRALRQYKKIPTLDAEFLGKISDDSILTVLKNGKGKDMKSFKEKMTPEEMVAVAKYVRTFGSAAPKNP